MKKFVVAIDGPAGSGKSSISKSVARKMGFTHIDTGAMYRAVTLEAMNRGIDLANEALYDFLDDILVIYKENVIYLNGIDVSKEIRTSRITNNVSTTAKLAVVRNKMVEFQRECAKYGDILMDGRDIGTVVFPDADLKIFLTATAQERAMRRFKEMQANGLESDYDTILKEIKERDYKDSNREIAPLKKADDAILIDTTKMSIEEVCEQIIELIEKRYNKMEDFNMESFEMKELKVGDKVVGEVVLIQDDKTIYLDVQSVTEGTMHLDHYTKDSSITSFKDIVKVGDKIKCEVAKVVKDPEVHIYLSRLNQLQEESFNNLQKAFEDNKSITVNVIKDVIKGYTCKCDGNNVFLPKSQAGDAKVGSKLEVKIIEIADKRVVVSRKVIDDEIYQANKDNEYNSINVGDVISGTIAKIENYGALVKFNYVQGLLKTNQVSHTFIDINKELSFGDKIEVKVISKENGKILLSKKALLKSPFELFAEEYKVGQTVTGKVVNKLAFGLLLEVAPNIKGLLHSSEYSHNPNDNFNNHVVIGDEVEVAILAINTENEKISLSRKALIDNPWGRVDAKAGDLVDVKVVEIKENGLLVEALGVDGFVPQSEALVEAKKDLASYYAVGDEAKAYIIDINPREWKLTLSIRKYINEQERKSYEKYLEADEAPSATLGDAFKDILTK